MKVILIHPKSSIKYKLGYRLFNPSGIPLGLAYVAAALEQKGVTVLVSDQNKSGKQNETIIKEILREKPDIVGFSCLANTLGTVRQISKSIKKHYRPIIVAGNINAVIYCEDLLKEGIIDVAVRCEGEYAMQEIVTAASERKPLYDIKGISFMHNNTIVHNIDRPPIGSIDDLPYPALHLFDLAKYREHLFFLKRGLGLPVSVSRGCNYHCVFCSNKVINKELRVRSPDKIAEEISFLNKRYGAEVFGLVGSYFPINVEHTEKFCEILIEKGLNKKIKWITESRVDKVTPALLRKMKEAGLHFIMFGCDFGTDRMLKQMHKGTTCQQAEDAVKAAKEAGIITFSYFLLGGPGETVDDCEQTIRFAKKIDSDIAKFNVTIPYPGSVLFSMYKNNHSLSYDNFDKISSWADWSSAEDSLICNQIPLADKITKLQRKAMFCYYFRPKMFTRILRFCNQDFIIRYIASGAYVMTVILLKITQSFIADFLKILTLQTGKRKI